MRKLEMTKQIEIGFLLFPNVTQLDLTGPAQVLSRIPNAKVHLIARQLEPIITDVGFSINPTISFANCPALDVICVPGGAGIAEQMQDAEILNFLRQQGSTAQYITSVCNGSLILGAAGLLRGRKSACHWLWRKYLSHFGAEPINARVVRDGKYLSGGGITAGIDFAFTLAAELVGEEAAKSVQLALEYSPEPPFDCGTPEKAGAERVQQIYAKQGERLTNMEALIERIALV